MSYQVGIDDDSLDWVPVLDDSDDNIILAMLFNSHFRLVRPGVLGRESHGQHDDNEESNDGSHGSLNLEDNDGSLSINTICQIDLFGFKPQLGADPIDQKTDKNGTHRRTGNHERHCSAEEFFHDQSRCSD